MQNNPYINCTNTTIGGIAASEIFQFNISVTANNVDSTTTLSVFTLDNSSATQTDTTWSMTIDSTPPALTLTEPNGNVSGTITINSTMTDSRPDNSSVEFSFGNVTNNYTKSGSPGFTSLTQEGTSFYFSDASVDTTNLKDGVYELYVRANDTLDNQMLLVRK